VYFKCVATLVRRAIILYVITLQSFIREVFETMVLRYGARIKGGHAHVAGDDDGDVGALKVCFT
jgi:hypothetical protein